VELLPFGWTQVLLGDVAEIIMGQSPPSSTYNTQGRGLPFFQGKAEFGRYTPTAVKYCSLPQKIAEKDDVLISVRAPVGPTNLCMERSCIGRGLAAIRSNGTTLSKYVLYYIRSIEPWLSEQGTGSTFAAISRKHLEQISIALAPLNEQHRIAAKLEELLAKVDKCIERLERIPAILKRFRNAVLSAAATGQLTSSLRKSDDIIGSWQQVKLGNAADLIQIGPFGSLLHKSEYVKDQIPLVNPTNIVAGRIIPSPDTTISPAKKRQLRRYALQEGDVVIGRRGEMGRCAVVTKKEDGWVCGTGSLFVRPHAKLLPSFLHILISSPAAIAYLEESNVGSTMANLNQGIFHQMEIPLPDVEEQHEIVHRVEALFKIADQVEARYRKAKAVVDKLTQSILAKAFRGELVPQDPNDEPAAELLKRIREERARRQETTGNGQNNRAGNRGRRKGKA